jgi:hypothetical protein
MHLQEIPDECPECNVSKERAKVIFADGVAGMGEVSPIVEDKQATEECGICVLLLPRGRMTDDEKQVRGKKSMGIWNLKQLSAP